MSDVFAASLDEDADVLNSEFYVRDVEGSIRGLAECVEASSTQTSGTTTKALKANGARLVEAWMELGNILFTLGLKSGE